MFRRKGHKLSRFFGQLEADIMEILWHGAPLSAKEIRFQLRLKKKLAATTVLTVLGRLVEKGHLEKTSKGRASVFVPTVDRDTFVQSHIKELLENLQKEFPSELKKALRK
jgi:predicted transcriptional regulator